MTRNIMEMTWKIMSFYELSLKPKAQLQSGAHFEGAREFITVQKGIIKITAGVDSNSLGEGDSAHYRGDVVHCIQNTGDVDAVCFLVVSYS